MKRKKNIFVLEKIKILFKFSTNYPRGNEVDGLPRGSSMITSCKIEVNFRMYYFSSSLLACWFSCFGKPLNTLLQLILPKYERQRRTASWAVKKLWKKIEKSENFIFAIFFNIFSYLWLRPSVFHDTLHESIHTACLQKILDPINSHLSWLKQQKLYESSPAETRLTVYRGAPVEDTFWEWCVRTEFTHIWT